MLMHKWKIYYLKYLKDRFIKVGLAVFFSDLFDDVLKGIDVLSDSELINDILKRSQFADYD